MKRLLIYTIPLIVIWAEFALAHFLDFDDRAWWAFPYMFTCIGLFVGSFIVASSIDHKLTTRERNNWK